MVDFSQATMFDPTQEAEIKRRRKMAEQLQAISAPASQTEVVSGFAVPKSGLEQLARGLAGGIGAYQEASAATDESELNKSRAELYAKALGAPSRQDAAKTLVQDPSTAKTAFDIAYPNAMFGGATGQFADRLIALGVDPLKAALVAKSGLGVGRSIDPSTGMVSPMAGVPEAGGQIKYGEKAGEKRAELETEPKIEASKVREKALAENKVNAETGFPDYQAAVGQQLSLINQMIGDPAKGTKQHPGLNNAIGPIDSRLPTVFGDTADFEALLEQARGGAFLDSIQKMRGLGALSNAEGQAATSAATRMKTATSEEGFKQAAAEYRDIMNGALQRAATKAGVSPNNPQTNDPLAGARSAIAAGADRNAVIQRLQQNGINPEGI